MPTTGKLNGTDLKLYIDTANGTTWVEIGCASSATINLETEMIEASCKGDDGWSDAVPGRRNWSIDVEGLVIYDNAHNSEEFMDIFLGKTKCALRWTTAETGDMQWTGSAFMTSYSETAAYEEIASYSASFQGVGAIAKGTIPVV